MSDVGTYVFDESGVLAANRRTDRYTINTNDGFGNFLVPVFAPFFAPVVIKRIEGDESVTLVEGVDYFLRFKYAAATYALRKPIYGGIEFIGNHVSMLVDLERQVLGGTWSGSPIDIYRTLAEAAYNPRVVFWDQITNVQEIFPPLDHPLDFEDTFGYEEVAASIDRVSEAIVNKQHPMDPIVLGFMHQVGELSGRIDLMESRLQNLEHLI